MSLPKGVEAKETGHPDMISRVRAARRLMTNGLYDLNSANAGLTHASQKFLADMVEWFEEYDDLDLVERGIPSAKQYFLLLDLYNEHCL